MVHVWKALGLHINNLQKKYAYLQNLKYLLQDQVFSKNVQNKRLL